MPAPTQERVIVGRDLLVVQTVLVMQRAPEHRTLSHFEVWCAPDADSDTPLRLVTEDEALYDAAFALDGTNQRVDVSYRQGRRHDGAPCKVLMGITRTANGPTVRQHGRP